MKIYVLIVLLSLLQSNSIYAAQKHPLAKLWDVEDSEVPKLLEREKNLIAIDKILRPILEQDNFISSFGGSVIYPKEDIITVHTVDFSKLDDLKALPQINPYKEFIEATKPYNPKIIYENSALASQNVTQLRRDVNSRNLNIKLLGHCYNERITKNEFLYAPWRSDSPPKLLIGPMVFHMTVPYDFGVINFVGKDVVPTFYVRNDVAAEYRELIITDSAPVSSAGAHICKSGRTTYFTC
ncbi:hypothetical protein C2G38_2030775 [Gigaspora rosea]|uniref:GLPGLI family protein n=1 Tax=Gigaspora rosea TaxID=44941 RepID=A0A397VTB2_9GLOM|nr:hypothetical protein C2G38_2030775 [Gigaspora rosea]